MRRREEGGVGSRKREKEEGGDRGRWRRGRKVTMTLAISQ